MTKEIKLSKRLTTIASCLSPASYFADIGTDHAYLPCYQCLKDDRARAIAGEVREGPYKRAMETVENHQLQDRVAVRMGNGLEVIKSTDRVNELAIAGMGGGLIAQILADGQEKLTTVDRMVLQPNTDAHVIRAFIKKIHFSLKDEMILEEHGHIYEILIAEKGKEDRFYKDKSLFEKQLLFGPILMQEKSDAFIKKWKSELEKTITVIVQMKKAKHVDEKKLWNCENRRKWIEEVLS